MSFTMQPKEQGAIAAYAEHLARRHARGFTTLLILLAMAVTVGLLFASAPPIVLYQGF